MAEEEDVISSLPDCLLLEIISRLPTTKHAIKTTSTLSKRWQHLWTFLPNLTFIESKDVRKSEYYLEHILDLYSYFCFIDKTLSHCPTHVNLNKFKLILNDASYRNFTYTWYESKINSWIRYAITRNVQEVNVELWDGGTLAKFGYDDDFIIKNLCAIQMKLTRCVFKNPIGAISWEKLKCLCISKGILDEDVIAAILSGSPCLETLELNNCNGFSMINVTSKSVKNLVYSDYGLTNYGDQDGIIKINAPYILSLTIKYSKDSREILLLNVSSLFKADLDYGPGHIKSITLGDSNFEEAKGFKFVEGADDSNWVEKRRFGGTKFFVLAEK